MSVSVAVTNYGTRKFSLGGFTTMDANPAVTKTKVVKQVNADDRSKNFDVLGKFGVVITEDGTARPGSAVVTGAGTLAVADRVAIVDMSASFQLDLSALSNYAVGDTVYIFVRSRTGAWTLTVDPAGAETINGNANATIATTGGILRIKKSSATAWVTAS